MRAVVLDPIADPRWEVLVTDSPGARVFHHPRWLALVRDEYGYPFEAWALEHDGRLLGGLPVARIASRLTGRRLVAVPFADRCGPLLVPGAAEPELLEMIAAQRRQARLPLGIHDQVPDLPNARPGERFYYHQLALAEDPAEVEAGFTKSYLLRGARKAAKLGLQIERRTDAAAVEDFYRLHLHTRRHQGVPVQSKRYIMRLTQLFEAGLGHVVLVVAQPRRPIASAVFLTFNGTLTYKYGASLRSELAKRPNNLLFVDAIRWGCQQGMARLDLGRTDHDNPGLREFKLAWGASEEELSYTWLSDGPAKAGRGVPAGMRSVIRRSPPIVGRAIGRVLYRHAA